MMRSPRMLWAMALLLALVLVSAIPSRSGPAQPKRGGTLTVGINADAATLNPFVFRFNVESLPRNTCRTLSRNSRRPKHGR